MSTRAAGDKARPPAAAQGRPERPFLPSAGGPSAIDEPLLSPNWFRVADLRLQLRPGVQVSVQRVRGQTWTLLTDPVSGRHHRFNAAAQALLPRVEGHDPATSIVTTLAEEKQFNTFFRLGSASVIARLREAFADLPEQPDAQTVFVKLRELRNTW